MGKRNNDAYLPEFPRLILSAMLISISLAELFAFQNYFHWGVVSLLAFWSFHLKLTGHSRVSSVESLNSRSDNMTLRSATPFLFSSLISPRNYPCHAQCLSFGSVLNSLWYL